MKTIILLSDFRSGSTACLHSIIKHPLINVPHVHNFYTYRLGRPRDWEMAYWSTGQEAIEGNSKLFIERMTISNPFISKKIRWMAPYTEEKLFELWDQIVYRYGPIVFEKSPQYLEKWETLDLIIKYANCHDVRLLAIVRNPSDCIPSQVLKWTDRTEHDFNTIENRWVTKYKNLQKLQSIMPVHLFSYDELVFETKRTFINIFEFCDLEFCPQSCDNIIPTHHNYYSSICSYRPSATAISLYEKLQ